jgi:hypothetical protein
VAFTKYDGSRKKHGKLAGKERSTLLDTIMVEV